MPAPKIGDLYTILSRVATPDFERALIKYMRDMANQINGLSEGKIYNRYNAQTSIPTSGSFAQGDFIPKSNPVEAGAVGSKYVVMGWICTVSGTPGTLLEARVLTGN
jgi:hypothetical protein